MSNGWAGKILRVNLNDGNFEKELTQTYSKEFLAGKGINTKILWDEVTPEIRPLDPENRLMFGVGLLAGTMVPAANRCSITSKSPQSNKFGDANLGGYWPTELKFAGYDNIVISGKSNRPVYLWIKDGHVELRNAEHLWGKDTIKTEVMIKDELKNDDVKVACIGPAGENQVVSAAIVHGLGNTAARTGMGAVMGAKNLKAIVVYGSSELNVAKPVELGDLCKGILNTGTVPPVQDNLPGFFEPGRTTYGNQDEAHFAEFRNEYDNRASVYYYELGHKQREISCFNCPRPCKFLISDPDVEGRIVLKCENTTSWSIRLNLCDPKVNSKAGFLCHKYGLDMMSTSGQIAFLMDLYEKGIITEEDTDGIPMKWKNAEAMYVMIEKIAKREGCGEIFAEGIVKAAEKIGKGADKYAYHIRGIEPSAHSLYHPGWAVGSAISEIGDALRVGSVLVRHHFPSPETNLSEALTKYIHSEKMAIHIPDLLGLCKFVVGFLPDPYYGVDTMAKLASYATGHNIDEDMLYIYCDRKINLSRAFDIREGITRKDDRVPERFFKEPSPVRGKPLDWDKFNKMLDEAYSIRGWDENGVPTRKTLEELGLKYVADDLERRKIAIK